MASPFRDKKTDESNNQSVTLMAPCVTYVLNQKCYRCLDRAREGAIANGKWEMADET